MEMIAKNYFPDFKYEILDYNGTIMATLTFHESDTIEYSVYFNNHDASIVSIEDIDVAGVWGVSFSAMSKCTKEDFDPYMVHFDANMLYVFCSTCDLTFSSDDLLNFTMQKMVCLANTLESQDPYMYIDCSGLFYEVGHHFYQVDPAKDEILTMHILIAHPTMPDFDATS